MFQFEDFDAFSSCREGVKFGIFCDSNIVGAGEVCAFRNATLGPIQGEQEFNNIVETLSSTTIGNRSFFIGLTVTDLTLTFLDERGNSEENIDFFSDFTSSIWADNQPEDSSEEKCIMLRADTSGDIKLFSDSCELETGFVCSESCQEIEINLCLQNETLFKVVDDGLEEELFLGQFLGRDASEVCSKFTDNIGNKMNFIDPINETEFRFLAENLNNVFLREDQGLRKEWMFPLAILDSVVRENNEDTTIFSFLVDNSEQNLSFYHSENGEFPWDLTEPNNFNDLNERCVSLSFNPGLSNEARLNDVNCVNRIVNGFICKGSCDESARIDSEDPNDEFPILQFTLILAALIVVLLIIVVVSMAVQKKKKVNSSTKVEVTVTINE